MKSNFQRLHSISRTQLWKNYLPQFVYWGIDWIVTTFAVVAWAVWANLSISIVLILGFANLFADGFSMAVGSYLSSKSEWAESPVGNGVSTLLSFIIVGFFPLLSYVLYAWWVLSEEILMPATIAITAFAFALIGYLKSVATDEPMLRSVLETLFLGLIAALIAYYVGDVLEQVISG